MSICVDKWPLFLNFMLLLTQKSIFLRIKTPLLLSICIKFFIYPFAVHLQRTNLYGIIFYLILQTFYPVFAPYLRLNAVCMVAVV